MRYGVQATRPDFMSSDFRRPVSREPSGVELPSRGFALEGPVHSLDRQASGFVVRSSNASHLHGMSGTGLYPR